RTNRSFFPPRSVISPRSKSGRSYLINRIATKHESTKKKWVGFVSCFRVFVAHICEISTSNDHDPFISSFHSSSENPPRRRRQSRPGVHIGRRVAALHPARLGI